VKNITRTRNIIVLIIPLLVVISTLFLSGCESGAKGGGLSAQEKKSMTAKSDPAHPPKAMVEFMNKARTEGRPENVKSPWSK